MASQLLKINIPVSPTYRVQPWLFHGETLPANWRETIRCCFYPVFLDSPPSPHGISWSNKYKGFQTSSGLVGFNIYFQRLRRRGTEWRCYHSHRGCSLSFFMNHFFLLRPSGCFPVEHYAIYICTSISCKYFSERLSFHPSFLNPWLWKVLMNAWMSPLQNRILQRESAVLRIVPF